MTTSEVTEELVAMFDAASRVVVLTGAGISAEAGDILPQFLKERG
jgi:NAD-dependent SIR2 family protein deacetylase